MSRKCSGSIRADVQRTVIRSCDCAKVLLCLLALGLGSRVSAGVVAITEDIAGVIPLGALVATGRVYLCEGATLPLAPGSTFATGCATGVTLSDMVQFTISKDRNGVPVPGSGKAIFCSDPDPADLDSADGCTIQPGTPSDIYLAETGKPVPYTPGVGDPGDGVDPKGGIFSYTICSDAPEPGALALASCGCDCGSSDVPEPNTLMLLGIGVLGIKACCWLRMKIFASNVV